MRQLLGKHGRHPPAGARRIQTVRVDFIKLDVEGMELETLQGADQTIKRSRPILLVEKIKCDTEQVGRWFAGRGYMLREVGINVLAVHSGDKVRADIIPATPAP